MTDQEWQEIREKIEAMQGDKSASGPVAHPCPSCGHCPHCGRGGYWGAPLYPYRFYPPYQPYPHSPIVWLGGATVSPFGGAMLTGGTLAPGGTGSGSVTA